MLLLLCLQTMFPSWQLLAKNDADAAAQLEVNKDYDWSRQSLWLEHIIHFINHLHTRGIRTPQHPWQWPHRQSSKRNHHNWIRYPNTSFRVMILLLMSKQAKLTNIARLHLTCNNYKAAAILYWSLGSILVTTITKDSSSLDWPRYWSYVSIMLANRPHYNIGLSSGQREILFNSKCLGTTKGH